MIKADEAIFFIHSPPGLWLGFLMDERTHEKKPLCKYNGFLCHNGFLCGAQERTRTSTPRSAST